MATKAPKKLKVNSAPAKPVNKRASVKKLTAQASPSNTRPAPPFLAKLASKASTGTTTSKASLHKLKPPKSPKARRPAKSRKPASFRSGSHPA